MITRPGISLLSAMIYQVFPRNYSASGDLDGVTADLDRIKSLGTDILYLTPIHPIGVVGRKGSMGSPYSIEDYRTVDPDLGGLDAFRRLVNKAKSIGLAVMIDVVYNHTACDARLLREHPEWYLSDSSGTPTRKVADWSDVLDLDFRNDSLREYLIETLEMWADRGVGGFRCDVAPLVPQDFWIEARKRVGERHRVIWLAESVHPTFVTYLRDRGYPCSSDGELYSAFDLTYDYDAFTVLQEYLAGRAPLGSYLGYLALQGALLPANAHKIRFLENHDQQRAARVFESGSRLRNWTAFTYLLPGANFVYMGQECAAAQKPNLFERDPVDWSRGDAEFAEFFASILTLSRRVKESAVRWSISSPAEGVAIIRWEGERSYAAILNLENRYGECPLVAALDGTELLSGAKVELDASMPIPSEPLIIELDR